MLRCTFPSTLVLLVLLTCWGTAVHAAPDPVVEAIQRALVERGFDPGQIDGAMGWRTRGAIRVFQRSIGLPDTGRADTATMEALGLIPPAGGEARAEADTPQTGTPGAEAEPEPGPDTPKTETPDAKPTTDPDVDGLRSESPPAVPAPVPGSHTPAAERPAPAPTTEPGADAPESESPAAEPVPLPVTDAPTADMPDATPGAEPGTATHETGTRRAEPAPGPDAVAPKAEKPDAKPATERLTDTPRSEAPPAQPAPKPVTKPKPAAKPKLSFEALGWHHPQTAGEALERFTAIGAPRDFKRGTGSLFVPKSELVFVLKAGERIPGLDCDPGAGRLSIEFVFGPDGPVIFTPDSGGAYCQMGIGIAISVGRTLDLRRVDWGDKQYPRGTVRVTNEGLEYVR